MVYFSSKLIDICIVRNHDDECKEKTNHGHCAKQNLLSGETPCCCLKSVYGQRATVELCCTLDVATHERWVRVARGDS